MTQKHPAPLPSGSLPSELDRPQHPGPVGPDWFSAEEEQGASIRSYVAGVLRHKWIIVLAATLGTAGGYIVFNQFEPEYTASGSLWVQATPQDGGMGGPIATAGLLPASSWVELLNSTSVLGPVAMEQMLFLTTVDPGDRSLFRGLELPDYADRAPMRNRRAEARTGTQVGPVQSQPLTQASTGRGDQDRALPEGMTPDRMNQRQGAARTTNRPVVPGSYLLRVSSDRREVQILRDLEVVDRARAGERLGERIGVSWIPPVEELTAGQDVAFSLLDPREAINELRSGLRAAMDQRGSFIQVAFSAGDPQLAADVVNGLMERHVDVAADLKRASLDEEYAILAEQLQYAETELAAAEGALETFRVQTITLPSDRPIQAGLEMTRDPVFTEFFNLRVHRESLRRDRERLEELAEGMSEAGVQIDAIEAIPSAAASSELGLALSSLVSTRTERRSLLQRYTEAHPLVVDLSEEIRELEENRIPSLLSQLVQQLQVEDQILDDQLASSETELSQIPPRVIEEAQLNRRVQIASVFFTDLQGRFQVANLARASSVPDVSVLDRAMPPRLPSTTNEQAGAAAAVLLIFLGGGVGGAFLLDRLDSRVRTPEEVSRAFGLIVLGSVPRIQNGNSSRAHRAIANVGQVYEAFRELRTNLTYAYGAVGPIVVTVSSSGMEEGKTTVTTNLGVAFAEMGKRTLIIDGDTRRGDLHHFLDGQRKPGLTDYLRSAVGLDAIVQGTAHDQLDFIGSGTQVANSPELLSSSEMGRMMSVLRKEYDVVLLDSPPLGAGADPLVLATMTGHLLLVIRSGATDRDFTTVKLEPLNRLPVRQLGVVLNDYEPSRLEFGYKQYGSYLPGYEAGAEEGELGILSAVVGTDGDTDAPLGNGKEA